VQLIGKLVVIAGVGGPFTVRECAPSSQSMVVPSLMMLVLSHSEGDFMARVLFGVDHRGKLVRVVVTALELAAATIH